MIQCTFSLVVAVFSNVESSFKASPHQLSQLLAILLGTGVVSLNNNFHEFYLDNSFKELYLSQDWD